MFGWAVHYWLSGLIDSSAEWILHTLCSDQEVEYFIDFCRQWVECGQYGRRSEYISGEECGENSAALLRQVWTIGKLLQTRVTASEEIVRLSKGDLSSGC